MIIDAKFLFSNHLISKLEELIRNSKSYLYLISPFIDLDERIKDALEDKLDDPEFKLYVLFGKNEDNIYKSIKNNSIDFLKTFPNCEIRYNKNLHAKFYLNEHHYILSSINLYDYSLANNIEVGIYVCHTAKKILGKITDGVNDVVEVGMKNLKENLFGSLDSKDVNPTIQFVKIFERSELMFKSEPIYEESKSIMGIMSKKKVKKIKIIEDNLIRKKEINKAEVTNNKVETLRLLSASKISKMYNVNKEEFEKLVFEKGLINENGSITKLGEQNGLVIKNYMGKDYIAYPDNILK